MAEMEPTGTAHLQYRVRLYAPEPETVPRYARGHGGRIRRVVHYVLERCVDCGRRRAVLPEEEGVTSERIGLLRVDGELFVVQGDPGDQWSRKITRCRTGEQWVARVGDLVRRVEPPSNHKWEMLYAMIKSVRERLRTKRKA